MRFTDQLGREVQISSFPKKIVSLVPSLTKLLADLELDNEVVGLTKFCTDPKPWWQSKIRVGGTKNIDVQRIKNIQPDLVIANKEENLASEILEISNFFPVWVSDVSDWDDAIHCINGIGGICNREDKAKYWIQVLQQEKTRFIQEVKPLSVKVCYLIWKDPWMTIGVDTFIHSMLTEAGFINVFSHKKRYPVCTIEEIVSARPDYIFLSSEPYPFSQKDLEYFKPQKAILVNGKAFSWYGSELLNTFTYLRILISRIT